MSVLLKVGKLLVDPNKAMVFKHGVELDLPDLSKKLLLCLLQSAPSCISKEALLQQVWGDTVISAETLKVRASLLRKPLAADGDETLYVQAVRNRGYKLAAAVTRVREPWLTRQLNRLKQRPLSAWFSTLKYKTLLLFSVLMFSSVASYYQYDDLPDDTASFNTITVSPYTLEASKITVSGRDKLERISTTAKINAF